MLTNIPPEQHQSYEALTVALDTHFGLSHQTELKRMQLKARTRCRDESLEELAEDVEHLVHLAYSEVAEAMVEVLATAKDQFVDALPDEDMRLQVRQNKPATLRDALGTALELESYQLASKQKTRCLRETQLEERHPVHQRTTDQTKEQTGDVLQQLVDALQQVTKGPGRQQFPTARKERNRPDRSNLVCWECKERGHCKRDCSN